MAAGIKYDLKGQGVERELCNQKTIYRLSGGFMLVDEDVPNGTMIPHLAPLAVDFETRVAKVVKCVKVFEKTTKSEKQLKVAKGSLVAKGMHLGTGDLGVEIVAIDKSNSDYDSITLKEGAGEVFQAGTILFEANKPTGVVQKNTANVLNYARVKVEEGATITAVGRAFEIQEDKLYLPISDKDKESLGARFMFI